MSAQDELIQRLVIPMVEQRSREPGDAWTQAAAALTSLIAERDAARAEVVAEQHRHGETGLALEAANAALKPFADVAAYIAETRPAWDHDDFDIGGALALLINLKAFRDARTALSLDTNNGDAKP